KPGEYRMLGIPAIYDRVCQQALLNRLEPIFEPVFDDASFGYRRGRSAKVRVDRRCGSPRLFGSADHVKAAYRKTVRAVGAADGGQRFMRASSDPTIQKRLVGSKRQPLSGKTVISEG